MPQKGNNSNNNKKRNRKTKRTQASTTSAAQVNEHTEDETRLGGPFPADQSQAGQQNDEEEETPDNTKRQMCRYR